MAFTEIDEKLLVRAYQAGDERAFDTIVRTQYNALYAHALSRLSQHEAAEDAVQDTLLRAYRALPNLDGDLALRAWLHRILTNVCYDEGNRRRRHHGLVEKVAALPEETAPDPVDDALLHETVRVMSEALADLPDAYREALVLRYVDGLSFREVAEVTGVTEENARARVHRGRQALHKVLSRLSVMAAFIIPGLRRAHVAADPSNAAAVSPDTANLATQLTSHVVQAAPTVSRFADAAANFGAAKTALAAAAVTAVAAVSVPAAVHTVQDATETKPPVTVAAPFTEKKAPTATSLPTTGSSSTTTSSSSSTSSTLPPSQTHPFEITAGASIASTSSSSSTSSTSTSTTSTTVAAKPAPTAQGQLTGDSLKDSGAAPQWDVSANVALVVGGRTTSGTLSGRLFVYDDGTAESDTLVVEINGKELDLRFRGTVTDRSTVDGDTTYKVSGQYVFTGAAAYGLPERGDVVVVFRAGGDAPTLSFSFSGRSGS